MPQNTLLLPGFFSFLFFMVACSGSTSQPEDTSSETTSLSSEDSSEPTVSNSDSGTNSTGSEGDSGTSTQNSDTGTDTDSGPGTDTGTQSDGTISSDSATADTLTIDTVTESETASQSESDPPDTEPVTRQDGANEEFRAVWLTIWDAINGTATPAANQAQCEAILNDVKSAGMNAIFWQVRRAGTSYFPNSMEVWGSSTNYTPLTYNPVAYAVEQAHARGLELHAWFNVFQAHDLHEGSIAAEHPDWICRDSADQPMTADVAISPGIPEARQYLVDLAMEVVRSADIDGLHLDYVRWNEATGANGRYIYDAQHKAADGVPAGFDTWDDWRRSVTEAFVRELHEAIQAEKPHVRLSAAVLGKYNWSGWQAYGTVYQDAALWLNEGLVEQLVPMHYHWNSGDEFVEMLFGGCPECWLTAIQEGIDAGRIFTVGPGSYKLRDDFSVHQEIVEQTRVFDWVDGFSFFSYDDWRDLSYFSVARSTFFSRNTKIRAYALDGAVRPPRPSLSVTQTANGWRFVLTPSAAMEQDGWFAIYRQTGDEPEPISEDEILYIYFGTWPHSFTVPSSFETGTFYATAFDRTWVESRPSTAVTLE